jgi:drug/metabolite transporter superfamily protein YnfA
MIAKIIVACLIAFAGILGLYAATASNAVSSRLAFAVCMRVIPAICTALLLRVIKSSNSWGAVFLAYFAVFVAEQLLWGWLHG